MAQKQQKKRGQLIPCPLQHFFLLWITSLPTPRPGGEKGTRCAGMWGLREHLLGQCGQRQPQTHVCLSGDVQRSSFSDERVSHAAFAGPHYPWKSLPSCEMSFSTFSVQDKKKVRAREKAQGVSCLHVGGPISISDPQCTLRTVRSNLSNKHSVAQKPNSKKKRNRRNRVGVGGTCPRTHSWEVEQLYRSAPICTLYISTFDCFV